MAGSFLVSYTRAKAEIMGLRRGCPGIGGRAERVVVITSGLVLAFEVRPARHDGPPDRHGLADGDSASASS